jgi:hypothetical protein
VHSIDVRGSICPVDARTAAVVLRRLRREQREVSGGRRYRRSDGNSPVDGLGAQRSALVVRRRSAIGMSLPPEGRRRVAVAPSVVVEQRSWIVEERSSLPRTPSSTSSAIILHHRIRWPSQARSIEATFDTRPADVLDHFDEAHASAAARALERVDAEDSLVEDGPGHS